MFPALRGSFVLPAALAMAVVGCTSRDTAPPVARVTVTPARTQVPIGGPVDFTYRFEVAPDARIDGDYSVFVHVIDADGRHLWNDDHQPPVPTSEWQPGRIIEYSRTQFVPRLASSGAVTVDVGLYRDDARLPLAGPDPDDTGLNERSYRVAALEVLPESESIFLVYTSGWHPDEFDEAAPDVVWKWTRQTAIISFANPRADAVLSLDYDARPDVFPDGPQTVTITTGGRVVDMFAARTDTRALRRIALSAEALGTTEMAEVRIAVDKTFVPANLPAGGRDERDLGLRVYHAFVERR